MVRRRKIMAETPRFAHLVTLLFFGAASGTIAGCISVLYGSLRKKRMAYQMGVALVIACAGGYIVSLLGIGAFSPNITLPAGSWKYFCEDDCHIAYAIADVQSTATLGTETNAARANGEYVIVKLKTWFDEKSISKFRGDGPLTPVPRLVALVDENGRRFLPSQLNAGLLKGDSVPLSQALRPGESYLTTFVFDVPVAARDLRLLITDDDPISAVLLDHENSPLHGKIYLRLGQPAHAASRQIR
jgi:hypothetical protein